AYAGGRCRERIPVRFLVADRGDEPPIDAAHALGFLEMGPQLRQLRHDLLEERAGVDGAETQRVPVVAVDEALQRAILPDALAEGARRLEDEALVDRGDEPRVIDGLADVDRDRELREEAARH